MSAFLIMDSSCIFCFFYVTPFPSLQDYSGFQAWGWQMMLCFSDLIWAPLPIDIKNNSRHLLFFCPIYLLHWKPISNCWLCRSFLLQFPHYNGSITQSWHSPRDTSLIMHNSSHVVSTATHWYLWQLYAIPRQKPVTHPSIMPAPTYQQRKTAILWFS